jgi:MFS family permease
METSNSSPIIRESDSLIPQNIFGSLQWYLSTAGVAALLMVCTLPGRTHGLGLITEPLIADLQMDRLTFAAINFWATILGAIFCIPWGWFIDRIGIRIVAILTLLGLGAVVIGMTYLHADDSTMSIPIAEVIFLRSIEWVQVPIGLFLLIFLTRGLGQSALSVISLSHVGRASGNTPGWMIGIYSFLTAIGFMAAFGIIQNLLEKMSLDWKTLWSGIGWCLIFVGGLGVVLFRERLTANPSSSEDENKDSSWTFGRALGSPAFWVFGIATSFYGLVASGMSLFNQSILAERKFDRDVFLTITTMTPMIGLGANLLTGWLATKIRLGTLLAIGLLVQTGALLAFPHVITLTEVYLYAGAMGIAGGMMTVIFFSAWRQMYGIAHLGKIQGAAQLLTVFASALGPLILAAGQKEYGSYAPVMEGLAFVSVTLAFAAWLVPTSND